MYPDFFASSSFSKSEESLLYTAEANPPEVEEDGKAYDKFRFRPHMGERLIGKKRPGIFLMQWGQSNPLAPKNPTTRDNPSPKARNTTVLRLTYPSLDPREPIVSFGQAVFDSDGTIFATGFEHTKDGRFLGIVGCFNRPTGIWEIRMVDGKADTKAQTHECTAKKLTTDDRSCRSPRVVRTSDGTSTLVWLSHKRGGPHHSCARLDARDLKTGEQRIVVHTVWEPDVRAPSPVSSKSAAKSDQPQPLPDETVFRGLYVDQLPQQPFIELEGKPFILTHSVCTHYNTIYLISLENGETWRAVFKDGGLLYSWSVLGTDGKNRFVCMRSRLDVPNELVLGTFEKKDAPPSLRIIDKPDLSVDSSCHLIFIDEKF